MAVPLCLFLHCLLSCAGRLEPLTFNQLSTLFSANELNCLLLHLWQTLKFCKALSTPLWHLQVLLEKWWDLSNLTQPGSCDYSDNEAGAHLPLHTWDFIGIPQQVVRMAVIIFLLQMRNWALWGWVPLASFSPGLVPVQLHGALFTRAMGNVHPWRNFQSLHFFLKVI